MKNNILTPDALYEGISPADCQELMIESVRYKKYLPWVECCARCLGPGFAGVLLNELRDTTRSPTHRGRLVDLIAVTGATLSPWDVITLANHRTLKCKAVREAVIRLLAERGFDGKPISQAAAAGLVDALGLKKPRHQPVKKP